MTALPVPLRPLTAAEYAELPEDSDDNYELQDGHVIMSAKPIPDHQNAVGELYVQLRPQIPQHLKVLLSVDLDMELAPPTQPGTVRVPDLAVVTHEAFLRVRREGGFLRAAECVLAVEIHSPGSYRTDRAIKHGEYADAGIGHYWMIDLASGPGPHRLPPRRPVRLRRRVAGHGHVHHAAPVPGADRPRRAGLSLNRRCAPQRRPAPSGCGSCPRRRGAGRCGPRSSRAAPG